MGEYEATGIAFAKQYGLDSDLVRGVRKSEPNETDAEWPESYHRLSIQGTRRVISQIDMANRSMLPIAEARVGRERGFKTLEIPDLNAFLQNLRKLDLSAREYLGGDLEPAMTQIYRDDIEGEDRVLCIYKRAIGGIGLRGSMVPVLHDLPLTDLLMSGSDLGDPLGVDVPEHLDINNHKYPYTETDTLGYADGDKALEMRGVETILGSHTECRISVLDKRLRRYETERIFGQGLCDDWWQSSSTVMCQGGVEWY